MRNPISAYFLSGRDKKDAGQLDQHFQSFFSFDYDTDWQGFLDKAPQDAPIKQWVVEAL